MRVYLVRHGQTNYNVARLHNDDPAVNVFLTELGKEQAKTAAEKLKDKPVDHIFISELRRTKQTAALINKYHNVDITVDSRLNDNRSGFEGGPDQDYEDLLVKAPDMWNATFNDGESLNDVKDRVKSFISDLRKKDYKSCIVVTSRVPAQFFYGVINGLTNDEVWNFSIDKGACFELELAKK